MVAKEDGSYDWESDLEQIAEEIDDMRYELGALYEHRAETVEQAWADGVSQRDIGYCLGISHTAVQKILKGQADPLQKLLA
jgi:DNA-directed RNA polymerase specialized sigma24 family protein